MRDQPLVVVWTDPALSHLTEAHEYISRDNPAAADKLIAEIRARVTQLAMLPDLGFRSNVRRTHGIVREVVVGPYRILYRSDLTSGRLFVLLVWHSARRNTTVKDLGII